MYLPRPENDPSHLPSFTECPHASQLLPSPTHTPSLPDSGTGSSTLVYALPLAWLVARPSVKSAGVQEHHVMARAHHAGQTTPHPSSPFCPITCSSSLRFVFAGPRFRHMNRLGTRRSAEHLLILRAGCGYRLRHYPANTTSRAHPDSWLGARAHLTAGCISIRSPSQLAGHVESGARGCLAPKRPRHAFPRLHLALTDVPSYFLPRQSPYRSGHVAAVTRPECHLISAMHLAAPSPSRRNSVDSLPRDGATSVTFGAHGEAS